MCTGNQDCGDCFDTGFITLPTGDTGLTGAVGPAGTNGSNGTNGTNGVDGLDGGYINTYSEIGNAETSGNDVTTTLLDIPVILENNLDRFKVKVLYENISPPVSNGYGLNFQLSGTGGGFLHLHASPQNYGNSYFKLPFDSEQATVEIELIRQSNIEIISIIKFTIHSSGVPDQSISYNAYSLSSGFDLDINSYNLRLSSYFASTSTIKLVGTFADKILAI